MKAYEAAKKLGISSRKFSERYGLDSHLCTVPKEIEAELFGDEKKIMEEQTYTETVDSAKTIHIANPGCIRFC